MHMTTQNFPMFNRPTKTRKIEGEEREAIERGKRRVIALSNTVHAAAVEYVSTPHARTRCVSLPTVCHCRSETNGGRQRCASYSSFFTPEATPDTATHAALSHGGGGAGGRTYSQDSNRRLSAAARYFGPDT